MHELSNAGRDLVAGRMRLQWGMWAFLLVAAVAYGVVGIVRAIPPSDTSVRTLIGAETGFQLLVAFASVDAALGWLFPGIILKKTVRPLLSLPVEEILQKQAQQAALRPRNNAPVFSAEERDAILKLPRFDQSVMCAFGPWYPAQIAQMALLHVPALIGLILVLRYRVPYVHVPFVALSIVLLVLRRPGLSWLAGWVTKLPSSL